MQNTRLTSLIDISIARSVQWLRNPWRRISLMILSVLFGNFLATAISTISGQEADLDITAALVLTGVTEFISWLMYRRRDRAISPTGDPVPRALALELLNAIKVGLLYGLFVEAFKLGS